LFRSVSRRDAKRVRGRCNRGALLAAVGRMLATIIGLVLRGSLISTLALGACSPPSSTAATAPAAHGARIDGALARQLVGSGATLLDVRTPEEFGAGHLDGAINISVDSLAARLAEIPRDRELVVYCRSGKRSARAASILVGAGHKVRDLGPISAW